MIAAATGAAVFFALTLFAGQLSRWRDVSVAGLL
jgi:hypothetical protein